MGTFYEKFLRPLAFKLPAETAHEAGLDALRTRYGSEASQERAAKRYVVEPFGELERFGLKFRNPLGVAAGFDKNGRVIDQLASLGFGFVEVGTVTFEPQPGNPKPRLFRLPADGALINRLGFNNDGAEVVADRLRTLRRKCVVGVNIGRNKDVPNERAAENYLRAFELLQPHADYVAINISSPNTPNLRDLHEAENLESLLSVLQAKNIEIGAKPLLLKISPDLSESAVEAVVGTAVKFKLDGIIATNTTVGREGLKTANAALGAGGLSGRPLRQRATAVIADVYKISRGELPIIGVGGVFTAEDAFEKIAAGACLLQAYTGFIYKGPTFARDLNLGLAEIIKKQGFASLDAAVGCGVG
jgi:dihydroorotate dehydrogenase